MCEAAHFPHLDGQLIQRGCRVFGNFVLRLPVTLTRGVNRFIVDSLGIGGRIHHAIYYLDVNAPCIDNDNRRWCMLGRAFFREIYV